jgi:DNA-binding phage protein
MSQLAKTTPAIAVEYLNKILCSADPITVQKVLLNTVHGYFEAGEVAERIGVRRETIWRYRTGIAKAPFGVIVKLIGLLGAKVVIVAEQ